MTPALPRLRRFLVACTALVCAAWLFRSQVAVALVVRGDDYMYRGQTSAALERYHRALVLSPSSQTAADRYVFVSIQTHRRPQVRRAIIEADRFLHAHPRNARLLADRALAYLIEQRFGAARADFVRAATIERSAQDYVFAGYAARHEGDHRAAAEYWRDALATDAHYMPAMLALEEHHR